MLKNYSTYYSILLFWKTLPIILIKSPIILLQIAKNKVLSMYRIITYGLRLGVSLVRSCPGSLRGGKVEPGTLFAHAQEFTEKSQ